MLLLDIGEVCNDLAVLRVIRFIKSLLDVIRIMVPVILTILCMIDFFKALLANEDTKVTSKIVKRFLSAIIIFFIIPVVNLFFGMLGEGNVNASDCWNNANDSNIEALAEAEKTKLESERQEEKTRREKIVEDRNNLLKKLAESRNTLINNPSNSVNTNNVTDDVNNPLLSDGGRIVAYAKQFVGNAYVYGGSWNGELPYTPTDCSGFVRGVYKHFGIDLPRTAASQSTVGTVVNGIENAKAGDLIFYANKAGTINHVVIYMGNNSVVHASSAKTGIKITNNASYRPIVAIRRIYN